MDGPSLPNLDRLSLSWLRCRIVCIESPEAPIVGICPSSGKNVCDWPPGPRKICVESWSSWRFGRVMPQRIIDLACRQISATNTGPWAGFGFQAGHMFTPDGHQLEPCDMAWWSLTSVIYLAEALRIRRERRFGVRDPGPNTEGSNVVYMSRGPRPRQRM